ncbi:MAG: F0F1 ATP synthase subunit delta [bacterium]
MPFDWFTVAAQIVNFLILVWLLKRFLYGPIINAIDEREHRIAEKIEQAEKQKDEAIRERETYEQKNLEFDRHRSAMFKEVEEEIRNERWKLLHEAKKVADDFFTTRRDTIKNEIDDLNKSMQERVQTEVFAIARKTLKDLASADLEEQISYAFIQKLAQMDDQLKTEVSDLLADRSGPVLIQSGFELKTEQKERIQQAIRDIHSTDVPVKFEYNPNVIAGIELIINSRKIGWSISEYLNDFQSGLNELLKTASQEDHFRITKDIDR